MKHHSNPFGMKKSHIVSVFNTPGQYADFVSSIAPDSVKRDVRGSFYGNSTFDKAVSKVKTGCKETASRADKLMSKLTASAPATVKRVKVNAPFGRVSVGAYLSNDPMPCRVAKRIKTTSAPLSVVVNVVCSASVTAEELRNRGVAVAALVKRVSKDRPVSLYICAGGAPYKTTPSMALVKFPTTPLDGYRLAYMLSDAAYTRGINLSFNRSIAKHLGKDKTHGSEDIDWFNGPSYEDSYTSPIKSDLENLLGTQVFYIPALYPYTDDGVKSLNRPIDWINDHCKALA